jgi:hypothetical protein
MYLVESISGEHTRHGPRVDELMDSINRGYNCASRQCITDLFPTSVLIPPKNDRRDYSNVCTEGYIRVPCFGYNGHVSDGKDSRASNGEKSEIVTLQKFVTRQLDNKGGHTIKFVHSLYNFTDALLERSVEQQLRFVPVVASYDHSLIPREVASRAMDTRSAKRGENEHSFDATL